MSEGGAPVVYLVLPAYDEEAAIPELFDRIRETAAHLPSELRVLLVDDGSADRTREVAERARGDMWLEVIVHERNRGLGATLRDGLLRASELANDADLVVTMDADNTHPPELMELMLRKIREGNDVVIASRFQSGARVVGLSAERSFLSVAAGVVFRAVLPVHGVRDYTCGFRGYRGAMLKRAVALHGARLVDRSGFECQVDLLLRLHRMGATMVEVPLVLRYDRKCSESKMRVGWTIFRTLKLVVKARIGLVE